jgi:hypothetical protein
MKLSLGAQPDPAEMRVAVKRTADPATSEDRTPNES